MEFEPTGMGNDLMDCGEFFVSFNPGRGALALAAFAQDTKRGETALCHRTIDNGRRKYFILNGDWRDDYRQLAPQGWDACVAFYESKRPANRSSWSEDDERAQTAVT